MDRLDNVHFYLEEIQSKENGGTYQVTLKIPSDVGKLSFCEMYLEEGSYTRKIPLTLTKQENGFYIYQENIDMGVRAGYRYFFKYQVNGKDYYITNRTTKTEIGYDEKNKMSVGFTVPEWAKGATMYHIFVDRFYRGSKEPFEKMERRQIHQSWDEDVVIGDNPNVPKKYPGEQVWNVDFYGGDLKGIVEKLDYLQSLGVDILYLSPIVRSQSNHRYDTADYENVDPYAGCNEDLRELCSEAHKRGMHVILDGVFNHTGDESKYFDRYGDYKTNDPKENGVFQSYESKYNGFYKRIGNGDYSYWWGFPTLPELNCDGEFWRNYICGEGGVIDQWFSYGIDGLRLDVADNLSDSALEAIHNAVIRNKKDGFILGEVWDNPMRNNRSYISSGRSMHSVMNYQLVDALIRYFKYQEPHKLDYTIRDIHAEYPPETIPALMNFTSTHDTSRAITLLGKKRFDEYDQFKDLEDSLKTKIFEGLWEIGFSNDDIFGMFYGSNEIDLYDYRRLMDILRGKGVSPENIQKIQSIMSYSPFERHKQWAKNLPEDIEKDLAYTQRYQLTSREYERAKDVYQAYLFFLATYPGIFSIFYGDEAGMQGLNNLANRRPFPWGKEDVEIQDYVQMLGQFRKKYPFLAEADFRLTSLTPKNVSFERIGEKEKLFVTINNSEEKQVIHPPVDYIGGEEVLVLRKKDNKTLGPYGGLAIRKGE